MKFQFLVKLATKLSSLLLSLHQLTIQSLFQLAVETVRIDKYAIEIYGMIIEVSDCHCHCL
jgi:hypothetical protein